VVSTESTEESWSPSLDIASSGTVHVAWWDSTNYYDPNSGSCGSDYDIFYKENSGTSYNSIGRGIIIAFGQGTLDTGTGQYNFNYGLLQFIGFAGGGPPFSYSDSAFTWTEGQYTPENYIGFSLQFGSFVIIIGILLTGGTINGTSYT